MTSRAYAQRFFQLFLDLQCKLFKGRLDSHQSQTRQMDTIDPNRCPICHEPNVCAVEKAKLPGSKPERCWCMDAVFTPDVMNQVPDAAKGKACICAKCAGGVA